MSIASQAVAIMIVNNIMHRTAQHLNVAAIFTLSFTSAFRPLNTYRDCSSDTLNEQSMQRRAYVINLHVLCAQWVVQGLEASCPVQIGTSYRTVWATHFQDPTLKLVPWHRICVPAESHLTKLHKQSK